MTDVIDLSREREKRFVRALAAVKERVADPGVVFLSQRQLDEHLRRHRIRERLDRVVREVQILKRNAGIPDTPLVAAPVPDEWLVPEREVPELPP